MDPVNARFAQLFIAEALGAVLCIGGLVLLFLGAAGKITLFMKGGGAQARLTNAPPGLVVAIIGVALVWLSLRGHVDREESHSGSTTSTELSPLTQDDILKNWVAKATDLQKSTAQLNYSGMTDAIVGKEPVRRFASSSSFIEVWKVSAHYGEDSKTRVQISGPAVQAANEELLALAEANAPLNIPALQDKYKARELDLLYGELNIEDARTLRELSIKYYGNARFWKILRWTNPVALRNATEETDITGQKDRRALTRGMSRLRASGRIELRGSTFLQPQLRL
jgi:hypothetical protein